MITCLFLIGWTHFNDTPEDFGRKLSNIAREFRDNIMDEDESRSLMHDASRVADDIEDQIKSGDYSAADVAKFRAEKKKAEALEAYIGAVGGCANSLPTIEDLNLANGIVGGKVTDLVPGKFCVDFISVTINDYIVYLGENNTNSNYTVSYNWKASDAMNSGNGTMGILSNGVRHIYDNREKPNQRNITIYGVSCQPF